MRERHHRRASWAAVSWAAAFCLGFALGACTVKTNDSDAPLGAAGTQAMNNPVLAAGSTGNAPATAGTGAMDMSQAGSGVANAAAGTSPASAAGTSAEPDVETSDQNPDGGMAPAADAGETPKGHEDLGKGDGSDVVTIGDSWMQILTNGGGIEGGLDRADTSYRHYSVPGTTLINGNIPVQYSQAKSSNPSIATVIMTGGGNDVMFTGGCNTKEACEMSVQMIADALDELWTLMADDGVTDVIYIQYSRNVGTAPSDTRPDTAPIPTICTTDRIRCHTVPTTDLVGPGDSIDGIHPTLAACDLIAAAVLEMMEKEGIRR